MSKGKEELEELEVQEVRMRIQLDKAKSLVASWMGESSSEDEQDPAEAAHARIIKGTGLGGVQKKAATSLALEKLKKQQAKPKAAQPQPTNSDSEEEVSRGGSVGKRGAAKSAFDMYKKKPKKK